MAEYTIYDRETGIARLGRRSTRSREQLEHVVMAELQPGEDVRWGVCLDPDSERFGPDGEVLPYSPPKPPPTAADVDAERDRRRAEGITFRGVRYQTRTQDREKLREVATMALTAIMQGAQPGDYRWANPDADFEWIAEDNSLVKMDAQTLCEFHRAVMLRDDALVKSARALKNRDSIPDDFAVNDQYWLTSGGCTSDHLRYEAR